MLTFRVGVTSLVVPQVPHVVVRLLAEAALELVALGGAVTHLVRLEGLIAVEGRAAKLAGREVFPLFSSVLLHHVRLDRHLLLRFEPAHVARPPLLVLRHSPVDFRVKKQIDGRVQADTAHQADVTTFMLLVDVLFEVVVKLELRVAFAARPNQKFPIVVNLNVMSHRRHSAVRDLLADEAVEAVFADDFEVQMFVPSMSEQPHLAVHHLAALLARHRLRCLPPPHDGLRQVERLVHPLDVTLQRAVVDEGLGALVAVQDRPLCVVHQLDVPLQRLLLREDLRALRALDVLVGNRVMSTVQRLLVRELRVLPSPMPAEPMEVTERVVAAVALELLDPVILHAVELQLLQRQAGFLAQLALEGFGEDVEGSASEHPHQPLLIHVLRLAVRHVLFAFPDDLADQRFLVVLLFLSEVIALVMLPQLPAVIEDFRAVNAVELDDFLLLLRYRVHLQVVPIQVLDKVEQLAADFALKLLPHHRSLLSARWTKVHSG